jgi:hypothetical protein
MFKIFQTGRKGIGLLIFAVALLAFPCVGSAADENANIKPINPVPKFNAGDLDYSTARTQHFDYVGPLDDVHDDSFVMGDCLIRTTPSYKLKGIKRGTIVGIKINDKGEITECEILNSSKSKSK